MRPTGTYTDWRWPPAPTGYTSFEWTVVPETDPTPDGYFWSHQFGLVGGDGGYVGLQTLGASPTGKIAIFSIWGAAGATGPSMVGTFGGEGTGYTARIPFEWRAGSAYRLSVSVSGDAEWSAHVAEASSADGQLIGRIQVPVRWRGLSDLSIMWTERYSGSLRSCGDIRRASARFMTPSASGGVAPFEHYNHLARPPGCPGSEVIDLIDGVRHVMGDSAHRS